MIRFTTESSMELEDMDELKKVVALMPWTPDQKEAFFNSGEHSEDDEAELDGIGTVETTHKFTFEEV